MSESTSIMTRHSGPTSTILLALLTAACAGGEPADGGAGSAGSAASSVVAPLVIPGTFSPTIGPDGNTVVFEGPDGLVVVDAGRHPAHSRQILDHAAARGKPIVAIVNTHWHLDHATGNRDLKEAYPEATLYTTRAVEGALAGFLAAGASRTEEALANPDLAPEDRARMERGLRTIREPAPLIPDVAVETQTTLTLAGRALELNVTTRAVTESDVWIWDAATGALVAGDLVTLPAPLFDTGCPQGWLAALDAVAAKPFERLVPGHGFVMDRAEFDTYRTAFSNLMACAADNAGEVCAEGWLTDADALLTKAAGSDYGDRDYARLAVTYYVDQVIRNEAQRARFCGA